MKSSRAAMAVLGVAVVMSSCAATKGSSSKANTGTPVGRSGATASGTKTTATGKVRPCPRGQVGTPPNCAPAASALTVDADTVVRRFDRRMKGISFGNWPFSFGSPYINEVEGLSEALAALNPGLLRYAGGTKGNYYGFNRTFADNAFDTTWTQMGNTYYERYGTRELASLDAFAKGLDAQVMIQVNVTYDDPTMWADMVRYAKEQKLSSIKYYEFSNELDLETFQNAADKLDPATYRSRVKSFQQAMLAVDPSIRIVAGAPATASDVMRTAYSCCGNQVSEYIVQGLAGAKSAGRDLSAVSFHWYENMGADPAKIFTYTYGNSLKSKDWWREAYSLGWGDKVGPWIRTAAMKGSPNTELGVSELNVDSSFSPTSPVNGNHIGALWFSDVLGRLAYNDVDWATQWDGYEKGANANFSLVYGDSGAIKVRPSYYAYFMYNKYFGDQMVRSTTFDNEKVSIWASKDTKDPGKLKLRVTNFTGTAQNMPIVTGGFAATSGQAFVLSSRDPLNTSAASATADASTTINGVKIDGMNIASSIAAIRPVNIAASGGLFKYTVPAYSSVSIVLTGSFK